MTRADEGTIHAVAAISWRFCCRGYALFTSSTSVFLCRCLNADRVHPRIREGVLCCVSCVAGYESGRRVLLRVSISSTSSSDKNWVCVLRLVMGAKACFPRARKRTSCVVSKVIRIGFDLFRKALSSAFVFPLVFIFSLGLFLGAFFSVLSEFAKQKSFL